MLGLKKRLPKEPSSEKLKEKGEDIERGDMLAIYIAAFLNLFLPILLMLALIFGLVLLIFR